MNTHSVTTMEFQSAAVTRGKMQPLMHRHDPAKQVPLLVILCAYVKDTGQTHNYWETWVAEKLAIFLPEQLFKKRPPCIKMFLRRIWRRQLFLRIAWPDPVGEAVCVLGRTGTQWHIEILVLYYEVKPQQPTSMWKVSTGWRAAYAQAPLGTARIWVSHLPSILRLPLDFETGCFSRHLGVFALPLDSFLLPATFLTNIWPCMFTHKLKLLDLGPLVKPKINTGKQTTLSFTV